MDWLLPAYIGSDLSDPVALYDPRLIQLFFVSSPQRGTPPTVPAWILLKWFPSPPAIKQLPPPSERGMWGVEFNAPLPPRCPGPHQMLPPSFLLWCQEKTRCAWKMLLEGLDLLPTGTVASRWCTLHCGVNHSLPSGVLEGWGGLSPSQRPLGISTFFYVCHKGYFLICVPAGFHPSQLQGLQSGEHLGITAFCASSGLGSGKAHGMAFSQGKGMVVPKSSSKKCGAGWPHGCGRAEGAAGRDVKGCGSKGIPGAHRNLPNPQVLPEQDFQVEKVHVSKDIPLSLQLPLAH